MYQTTGRRFGSQDFGRANFKAAVDFARSKKMDCALACIAWGRAVRPVCQALRLSRSHVWIKARLSLALH